MYACLLGTFAATGKDGTHIVTADQAATFMSFEQPLSPLNACRLRAFVTVLSDANICRMIFGTRKATALYVRMNELLLYAVRRGAVREVVGKRLKILH